MFQDDLLGEQKKRRVGEQKNGGGIIPRLEHDSSVRFKLAQKAAVDSAEEYAGGGETPSRFRVLPVIG